MRLIQQHGRKSLRAPLASLLLVVTAGIISPTVANAQVTNSVTVAAVQAPAATKNYDCDKTDQVWELPLLRRKSGEPVPVGTCVKYAQELESANKCPVALTSRFDPPTVQSTICFQNLRKLAPDAQIGFRTWRELRGEDRKRGPNYTEREILLGVGCPTSHVGFDGMMEFSSTAQDLGVGGAFALTRECAEDLAYTYDTDVVNEVHASGIFTLNAGRTSRSMTGATCTQIYNQIVGGIQSSYYRPNGRPSTTNLNCALARVKKVQGKTVRVWTGSYVVPATSSHDALVASIVGPTHKGDTSVLDLGRLDGLVNGALVSDLVDSPVWARRGLHLCDNKGPVGPTISSRICQV